MKNLLQLLSDKEEGGLDGILKKEAPETEYKPKESKEKDTSRKFIVMSTFGELLDVAIHLSKVEKEKVLFCVTDPEYKKIGDGIVEKEENWHNCIGKGYIWVIDGCERADLQDWLREQGEYVVGTNKVMSEYEEDRQKGQEFFKKAGFKQPESHNFKDIDKAIEFVRDNPEKRWVMKQNGSAPKSLNHIGKFEGSEDMLYHLDEAKKSWNEHEYGAFDCDLMEFVDGVEVAASAFFNGSDWLRDRNGNVVGWLNFEEKKECDGSMGETTGETGTTFYGCDETNEIFKDILLRDEVTNLLKKTNYRGVFDINGSLTDDGFVAFEPTSRFGIPATSYEFIAGLQSDTADLLEAMACGYDTPIETKRGWGMVIVVTAAPYPIEGSVSHENTSLGEKLWILEDGSPVDNFSSKQLSKIHLENFLKDEDGNYKVATPNGYLLVVSGTGKTIEKTRERLMDFIKENIYISGMKYRTDIGKRIEGFL